MSEDKIAECHIGYDGDGSPHVVVDSIDGLYDRKVEHAVYDISDRKPCFGFHKWVDASLDWRKKAPDGGEWCRRIAQDGDDNWYGMFSFCTRCKKIRCVHSYDNTTYRVIKSPFHYTVHVIGECRICGARILRSGCTHHGPADDSNMETWGRAHQIIREEIPNYQQWGSWIHCEAPTYVARMILASGEVAARDYCRRCYAAGHAIGRGWIS